MDRKRNFILTAAILIFGIVFLTSCATTREWMIKGCIMDPDGKPIAKAKIRVERQDQHYKAFSKQDGRFSVGIPDRDQQSTLSVSASGYTDFIPLRLMPNSYCRYFNLYLYPTPLKQDSSIIGKLYGTISDESGDPSPGCSISIDGTTLVDTADINGFYLITKIPSGVYGIFARVIGYYPVYCYPIHIKSKWSTKLNIKFITFDIDCGLISGFGLVPLSKKLQTSNEWRLNKDQLQHNPAIKVDDLLKSCPGLNR